MAQKISKQRAHLRYHLLHSQAPLPLPPRAISPIVALCALLLVPHRSTFPVQLTCSLHHATPPPAVCSSPLLPITATPVPSTLRYLLPTTCSLPLSCSSSPTLAREALHPFSSMLLRITPTANAFPLRYSPTLRPHSKPAPRPRHIQRPCSDLPLQISFNIHVALSLVLLLRAHSRHTLPRVKTQILSIQKKL